MATVNLRFRGITPLHMAAAAISAYPLVFVAYQALVRHASPSVSLAMAVAAVAALPWLSRAAARITYRAKCDEVAVHVRGEALPYRTITRVSVARSHLGRRTTLTLERGQTVRLELVLRDAFAGRLEPLDELAARLAQHGHPLPGR
jgi:hypothetical protein